MSQIVMGQATGRAVAGDGLKGAPASIRKHLIVGFAVVGVLAGGLGGWASTQLISGALIAPGQIVVESNVKKVQHPTGGVVGELRARDGDVVKAGDIVARLRAIATQAWSRPAISWCGSTTSSPRRTSPSSPRISMRRRRARRGYRPSSAGST